MSGGIPASYYDGASSKRHAVLLQLDEGEMLSIHGETVSACYPLAEVSAAYRIGKRARKLQLADGASLELEGSSELDALLDRSAAHRHQGLVHRLESRLRYIALALVLTLAAAYGFLTWGVPAIARGVAEALPVETQDYLGEGTLEFFDKYLMQPSTLSSERQRSLSRRFQTLIAGLPERERYELLFRSSEKMGANAFALPSGSVVITDQLIALAHNDEEIASVLAHEIGHIHYRHSLRGAIQSSSAAVVIALMTGDLATLSNFAAALPTLLVEMNYSRSFETEADGFARQLMGEQGIPLHHFADILTRLSESHGDDGEGVAFLSTHPSTRQRIQGFQ